MISNEDAKKLIDEFESTVNSTECSADKPSEREHAQVATAIIRTQFQELISLARDGLLYRSAFTIDLREVIGKNYVLATWAENIGKHALAKIIEHELYHGINQGKSSDTIAKEALEKYPGEKE